MSLVNVPEVAKQWPSLKTKIPSGIKLDHRRLLVHAE